MFTRYCTADRYAIIMLVTLYLCLGTVSGSKILSAVSAGCSYLLLYLLVDKFTIVLSTPLFSKQELVYTIDKHPATCMVAVCQL